MSCLGSSHAQTISVPEHARAVMAVEGGHAISGHLHQASIGTWFGSHARMWCLSRSTITPLLERVISERHDVWCGRF